MCQIIDYRLTEDFKSKHDGKLHVVKMMKIEDEKYYSCLIMAGPYNAGEYIEADKKFKKLSWLERATNWLFRINNKPIIVEGQGVHCWSNFSPSETSLIDYSLEVHTLNKDTLYAPVICEADMEDFIAASLNMDMQIHLTFTRLKICSNQVELLNSLKTGQLSMPT